MPAERMPSAQNSSEPLAVGQIRENPYNGQRCIVREVVNETHANETHANVDWFGWPFSSGPQDVGWTTFVRMAAMSKAQPSQSSSEFLIAMCAHLGHPRWTGL